MLSGLIRRNRANASRFLTLVFVVTILLTFFVPSQKAFSIPTEEMRTVFMIGDISDDGGTNPDPIPLHAYIVYGDQLILAETFYVPTRLGGGVGLAVDHANELLFLSFEYGWQTGDTDDLAEDNENDFDGDPATLTDGATAGGSKEASDTIDVFDARTGAYLNSIYLAGTSDLAGMVVHQDRGHLYVVDRGDKTIFVFDTNNNFSLVEQWTLPTGSGAWGIDLVGDTLYTTDTDPLVTHYIRWYDIDTHQELGSYNFPEEVTGIVVVDEPTVGHVIYATGFDGGLFDKPNIQRYEVSTGNFSNFTLGHHGTGISANPTSNLIYAAHASTLFTGSYIKVFEADTGTELNAYEIYRGARPTDVVASAIPFGGTVSKTCTSHPTGLINQGDQATFEITVENKGSLPLVYIPLNDLYDDTHFDFVSSSPSPNNPTNGNLNWNDLTISMGDLAAGASMTITVTLEATDNCLEDLEGTNLANVEGALDSIGGEMWAAGVFDYQIICGCTINSDCDDGDYCNGEEWCDGDGDCQSGSLPCEDDGEYCNGVESCNEQTDECKHSGNPCPSDGVFCDGDQVCQEDTDSCEYMENPCPDDGLWCTGEEGCDEENDVCTTTGNPCSDDGVFCNGAESCDEEGKACVSAGDPCGSDDQFCNGEESCNEADKSCESSGDPCDLDEVCDEELDICVGADVDDDDTPGDEGDDDEEVWPEGKVSGGCCGCD